MTEKAIEAGRLAFDIEAKCILEMKDGFELDPFSNAVQLLCRASLYKFSALFHLLSRRFKS